MLSELRIYERRLDRIEAGLPPYAFEVGGDGYVPTLVDASTLDELYSLLDSTLSRFPPDEEVLVEDLVSGGSYRGTVSRVRSVVRSRYLIDLLI